MDYNLNLKKSVLLHFLSTALSLDSVTSITFHLSNFFISQNTFSRWLAHNKKNNLADVVNFSSYFDIWIRVFLYFIRLLFCEFYNSLFQEQVIE